MLPHAAAVAPRSPAPPMRPSQPPFTGSVACGCEASLTRNRHTMPCTVQGAKAVQVEHAAPAAARCTASARKQPAVIFPAHLEPRRPRGDVENGLQPLQTVTCTRGHAQREEARPVLGNPPPAALRGAPTSQGIQGHAMAAHPGNPLTTLRRQGAAMSKVGCRTGPVEVCAAGGGSGAGSASGGRVGRGLPVPAACQPRFAAHHPHRSGVSRLPGRPRARRDRERGPEEACEAHLPSSTRDGARKGRGAVARTGGGQGGGGAEPTAPGCALPLSGAGR